jgi:pimeloyl-ACP methyl ester carboxylesterase
MRATSEYHPFRSAETRDRYLRRYDEQAATWPVPSEASTVPTAHGDTFVRISGPTDGQPLVLLPGLWGNSLMWIPVIERLSERHRTYAVDNVCDFGRSSNKMYKGTAEEYVRWLDELFDGLGLPEGIDLVGCSFGTWVAAEYALHAPDRLAKLVWSSPGGVVAAPNYKNAVLSLPLMAAAFIAPARWNVGGIMRSLFTDSSKESIDNATDDMVLGLRCFTRRPFSATTNRVFSEAELAGIRVPVLYVVGANDPILLPSAAVERLNRVAPSVETVLIPGAGHDLVMAQSDAMCDAVLRFLDGGQQWSEPAAARSRAD